MIEIICHTRYETVTEYRRAFHWKDRPSAGFSFDCDVNGEPSLKSDAARENFEMCLRGVGDNGVAIIDEGVQVVERTIRHPSVGRCVCKRKVTLSGFTNTCECGREYNSAGQALASREQWGEETGETAADLNLPFTLD